MTSPTGTDRPSRLARFRAHPLGQLVERGARLALIGAAVVKVHERVLAFQSFAGLDDDCGCGDPDQVPEGVLRTWPVDGGEAERHETPQEGVQVHLGGLVVGDQWRLPGDDEWHTIREIPVATPELLVMARLGPDSPGYVAPEAGDDGSAG